MIPYIVNLFFFLYPRFLPCAVFPVLSDAGSVWAIRGMAGWILGFADSVSPVRRMGPAAYPSGIKGDISGTALGDYRDLSASPGSIIPAGKTESGALSGWQQPDIRRDGRIGFRIGMGASLQIFIADSLYNGNQPDLRLISVQPYFPAIEILRRFPEGIGILLRKSGMWGSAFSGNDRLSLRIG